MYNKIGMIIILLILTGKTKVLGEKKNPVLMPTPVNIKSHMHLPGVKLAPLESWHRFASIRFVEITFKYLVLTSQKTHCDHITTTNSRSMTLTTIIDLYTQRAS